LQPAFRPTACHTPGPNRGAVLGFESIRPAGVGGVIESSYRRMPPDKQPRLAGYTGEYVSDEVGAAWCVLERDAQLFVRRRGFQDWALHMLWKDAAAGPSGILQFERNANGISGFRLRNSRIKPLNFESCRQESTRSQISGPADLPVSDIRASVLL
jgi:hypothetical protein